MTTPCTLLSFLDLQSDMQMTFIYYREEHRKRAIKASTSCPFIEHTDLQTTKPPLRAASQPMKPPSKSKSKPPSRSTLRTKHQDVVMPTKTFDGEDESDVPTPPTTKKMTRSRSKSVARPAEVTLQPDDKGEVFPSRKPSRSRAKSKAPVQEEPEEEEPPRMKSTLLDTAEPKDTPFPSHPLSDLSEKPSVLAEPVFVPPLSRLPFMPLLTLSEAELDMTVEDWIRYHIEVEQDRFKRDGERELERFKEKAEEVRNAIESL